MMAWVSGKIGFGIYLRNIKLAGFTDNLEVANEGKVIS